MGERRGIRGMRRVKRFASEWRTIFGWMKTVGGFRRTRYRGVERTGLAGYLVAAAYNLVRMAKLLSSQTTRAVQPV